MVNSRPVCPAKPIILACIGTGRGLSRNQTARKLQKGPILIMESLLYYTGIPQMTLSVFERNREWRTGLMDGQGRRLSVGKGYQSHSLGASTPGWYLWCQGKPWSPYHTTMSYLTMRVIILYCFLMLLYWFDKAHVYDK